MSYLPWTISSYIKVGPLSTELFILKRERVILTVYRCRTLKQVITDWDPSVGYLILFCVVHITTYTQDENSTCSEIATNFSEWRLYRIEIYDACFICTLFVVCSTSNPTYLNDPFSCVLILDILFNFSMICSWKELLPQKLESSTWLTKIPTSDNN